MIRAFRAPSAPPSRQPITLQVPADLLSDPTFQHTAAELAAFGPLNLTVLPAATPAPAPTPTLKSQFMRRSAVSPLANPANAPSSPMGPAPKAAEEAPDTGSHLSLGKRIGAGLMLALSFGGGWLSGLATAIFHPTTISISMPMPQPPPPPAPPAEAYVKAPQAAPAPVHKAAPAVVHHKHVAPRKFIAPPAPVKLVPAPIVLEDAPSIDLTIPPMPLDTLPLPTITLPAPPADTAATPAPTLTAETPAPADSTQTDTHPITSAVNNYILDNHMSNRYLLTAQQTPGAAEHVQGGLEITSGYAVAGTAMETVTALHDASLATSLGAQAQALGVGAQQAAAAGNLTQAGAMAAQAKATGNEALAIGNQAKSAAGVAGVLSIAGGGIAVVDGGIDLGKGFATTSTLQELHRVANARLGELKREHALTQDAQQDYNHVNQDLNDLKKQANHRKVKGGAKVAFGGMMIASPFTGPAAPIVGGVGAVGYLATSVIPHIFHHHARPAPVVVTQDQSLVGATAN